MSGALHLNEGQIDRHLEELRKRPEPKRRLVLLTPDDSRSQYIERFRSRDPGCILHLSWKRVYDFLQDSVENRKRSVFTELVGQFLDRIRDMVFEQDIAGVIVKIDFSDRSGVDADKYLKEMKEGKWKQWNTPRAYKNLNGTGRKLLLYDRTKQGITVEVEIKKVGSDDTDPDYPSINEFAENTLRTFDDAIPIGIIHGLKGFENFGVHRKDRSPYRNITLEQYQKMHEKYEKMLGQKLEMSAEQPE